MEKLDILAFGAHPDDIEIGMGASIAKHVRLGYQVGMVDLTRGEMSTNGTPDVRLKEALAAQSVLGAQVRCNLEWSDRHLEVTPSARKRIVEIVRAYKPRVVFLPSAADRHPDHGICSRLVYESLFDAALWKFSQDLPIHRVQRIYYYLINDDESQPSVIVDVSEDYAKKCDALACHRSQFVKDASHRDTPLNAGYIRRIENRDKVLGDQIGTTYGEGFLARGPLAVTEFVTGGFLE